MYFGAFIYIENLLLVNSVDKIWFRALNTAISFFGTVFCLPAHFRGEDQTYAEAVAENVVGLTTVSVLGFSSLMTTYYLFT